MAAALNADLWGGRHHLAGVVDAEWANGYGTLWFLNADSMLEAAISGDMSCALSLRTDAVELVGVEIARSPVPVPLMSEVRFAYREARRLL